MTFANPEYFYLLLLLPLMAWRLWRSRKKAEPDIQVSSSLPFAGERTMRVRLIWLIPVFRMVALTLLVVSLARPRSASEGENVTTEGIDIVLVIDVSGSMLAEDFTPNRIESAKRVALEFIKGRPEDRIGLVVFAGESFTQCPLTLDHDVLSGLLADIRSGLIEDGTAIGMGLATGVSRLKESQAKSRVIILLTDGVNNRGSIDPRTAAGIAETFGIRVYTVGVGTMGSAPYPVQTPFGTRYQNVPVEIDEELLRSIAEKTDGKYFRATDDQALQGVYDEIDRLEKSRIEVTAFRRYREEFYDAAFLAGGFMLAELLLGLTFFRRSP
jgi:Ca-activated chloride channel family protein